MCSILELRIDWHRSTLGHSMNLARLQHNRVNESRLESCQTPNLISTRREYWEIERTYGRAHLCPLAPGLPARPDRGDRSHTSIQNYSTVQRDNESNSDDRYRMYNTYSYFSSYEASEGVRRINNLQSVCSLLCF